MTAEFIYTCHKLGRFYPPDRQVLADISLSFYPGAKIGVLGLNGAGKSTLLNMLMGLEKALDFVEKRKNIAAYFIYRNNSGTVSRKASSAFLKLKTD